MVLLLLESSSCFYKACTQVPFDLDSLHEVRLRCNFLLSARFDSEWPHHLAYGSQLHAFSPSLPLLCRSTLTIYWKTCERRLAGKKKLTHRRHCSCFSKRIAFLSLPWSEMGVSTDSWARAGRWKSVGRKCSLHRTVLLVTWQFAPSSRRSLLTSVSWVQMTVGSYERIV